MTSTTSLVPAEATEPTLIKTDVLGRMHRTPEQREKILDQYERSGLSGAKFAALCGVKYQTFANWLQDRKRQRKADPKRRPQRQAADRVQWLEASVQPASAAKVSGLVLELPGGVHAQISHPHHITLAAEAVLTFSGSLKIFVAVEPCDMRKGFNGLHALASERLAEDPRQGALFVFINRRHNRIKILYFDGTGLWVMTKRLEQGTFSWPKSVEPGTTKLVIRPEALALLTDGVDLKGAKLRPWYERES